MCDLSDGARVVIRHSCGGEQAFELETGEPQTYDHPGEPDVWYPIEPFCCELIEGDYEAVAMAENEAVAAANAACDGRCRPDLEDLPL